MAAVVASTFGRGSSGTADVAIAGGIGEVDSEFSIVRCALTGALPDNCSVCTSLSSRENAAMTISPIDVSVASSTTPLT